MPVAKERARDPVEAEEIGNGASATDLRRRGDRIRRRLVETKD
jgi:hypothetical protein